MTKAQEEKYEDFNLSVKPYGYDWEPHEVKTDDGWHLTIFRVIGRHGKRPSLEPENVDKFPLLF